MNTLSGQTAVITGAAQGIGRSIAHTLANHGASVATLDVHPEAERTATELRDSGATARHYPANIAKPDEVAEAAKQIANDFSERPTVLINNAGIIRRGTLFDLSYDDWRAVLEVNVTGAFVCCKEFIPAMIDAGHGHVVNITSVAGKMGDITAAPVYGASKGALNAFTKSLARQLADYGVLVNAVAPHAIETSMSAEWDDEKRAAVTSAIPLQRLGTTEEVAETVLFLLSPGARFITGEIIDVNGGFLMD